MNIGIITQARMSSNRLPGKVLKKIRGIPLLGYHASRALETHLPLVIATSIDKKDDIIETFCDKNNLVCFRGSLNNVLERYYHAAKIYEFDTIVRITADCPLIDSELIRRSISKLQESHADYVSNTVDRTFPIGFDVEVFTRESLNRAYFQAKSRYEQEHVTPYIWTHPKEFHIEQITEKKDNSNYRLTVDEIDDFRLIRRLIEEFGAQKKSYREIITILDENPKLASSNKHTIHTTVQLDSIQ